MQLKKITENRYKIETKTGEWTIETKSEVVRSIAPRISATRFAIACLSPAPSTMVVFSLVTLI